MYYFRYGPGIIPELYDANLSQQVVTNLDAWLQNHTHQRYSLQSLLDMALAFADALRLGYDGRDIASLCKLMSVESIRRLFCSQLIARYSACYAIECTEFSKLSQEIDSIRSRWDGLIADLGKDQFCNLLNRWWRYCQHHAPGHAPVFARFLERLGESPHEPSMPDTSEWDKELTELVMAKLFPHGVPVLKGVPEQLLATANRLR